MGLDTVSFHTFLSVSERRISSTSNRPYLPPSLSAKGFIKGKKKEGEIF